MAMQLHELHASVIHAPLVLLPAAAAIDVAAVSVSGRVRRRALDAAGRRVWWAGVGAAALAGVAGMAASQEVRAREPRARDAMWLHGIGNTAILLAGIGLASWRWGHRATIASASLGAGAACAALYTAWLGGELVYTHGVGVKWDGVAADTPPVLSPKAPARFFADAAKGLGWLLGRAGRLVARREPLAEGAATRASSFHRTQPPETPIVAFPDAYRAGI